jgi:hypothetical protein
MEISIDPEPQNLVNGLPESPKTRFCSRCMIEKPVDEFRGRQQSTPLQEVDINIQRKRQRVSKPFLKLCSSCRKKNQKQKSAQNAEKRRRVDALREEQWSRYSWQDVVELIRQG